MLNCPFCGGELSADVIDGKRQCFRPERLLGIDVEDARSILWGCGLLDVTIEYEEHRDHKGTVISSRGPAPGSLQATLIVSAGPKPWYRRRVVIR